MEAYNLKASPVPIRWHVSLPIFAAEAFLRSQGAEYGWIGGTDKDGMLRCVLPYTAIHKTGFHMIRFQTGTVPLLRVLSLEEEKSFLNSAVEHFRSTGVDLIIPSGNHAIFQTYPDSASAAPYGTFVNDLTQGEEALEKEIRKTYRQNIRKALAEGVEIKSGPEYRSISYDLVAETLKRSGASFKNRNEYELMLEELGEHVKIFVAEHKGTVQACMVAPFSKFSAYNCYAGTRPHPVLGSMHLLHWEAMKQFRALGVKQFDFQGVRIDPVKGSKQEGIANYKKGFGGRFVRGFLWKSPIRPFKSLAYSIAVRLLKGGDIVDQEGRKLVSEELVRDSVADHK